MNSKKLLPTLLTWWPSLMISLIFISNALTKIIQPNHTEKIVTNSSTITIAGIYLVIATILYLYNKTIYLGTLLLSLYMTCIVGIHIYKGKPYEVTILMLIATILASFIRKPNSLHKQKSIEIST